MLTAWCLLHMGLLKEALSRINSHVALNPEVGEATIDGAVIGFLAFDGEQGWEDELAKGIRATSRLEKGVGYLAELRALAPQWRRLSVATPNTLDAMLKVVEQAASR